MSESKLVTLVWYELVTDTKTYKISEKQKTAILQADSRGARFIEIEDAVINTAFIRGMEKKYSYRDDSVLEEFPITEEEKKFLVESPQNEQLESSDRKNQLN